MITFAVGALVEWFIVSVVYLEIDQIEEETTQARKEVSEALKEIQAIHGDINETKADIQNMRDKYIFFDIWFRRWDRTNRRPTFNAWEKS